MLANYFIALTMDNASTNNVLARTLASLLFQRYGVHFTPENGQIRCMAHVINLIVQKILSRLVSGVDDPDAYDYYLANKFLPFHYDPGEELIDLEAEGVAERDEKICEADPAEVVDEPIEPGLSAVQKVC